MAADGSRVFAAIGVDQPEGGTLPGEAVVEAFDGGGVAVGDGAIGLHEEQDDGGLGVEWGDELAGEVEDLRRLGAAADCEQCRCEQ